MKSIYISVGVHAGSPARSVCHELAELATRLDINVSCTFNGVLVDARPNEDGEVIYRSLYYHLSQGGRLRSASYTDGLERAEAPTD